MLLFFVCLLGFLGGNGDLFWWSSPHQNSRRLILLCGAWELLPCQRYNALSYGISYCRIWLGVLREECLYEIKIKKKKPEPSQRNPKGHSTAWYEMENIKIAKILGFMPFLSSWWNFFFNGEMFFLLLWYSQNPLSPGPLFFFFLFVLALIEVNKNDS